MKLKSQHRAKSRLALRDSIVGFMELVEGIGLGHHLHLALGGEVEGLVEEVAAVLLAAQDADPFHDQISGRNGERLGFETHQHETSIRPQALDGVRHRVGGIAGAEDHVGPAELGQRGHFSQLHPLPTARRGFLCRGNA